MTQNTSTEETITIFLYNEKLDSYTDTILSFANKNEKNEYLSDEKEYVKDEYYAYLGECGNKRYERKKVYYEKTQKFAKTQGYSLRNNIWKKAVRPQHPQRLA